MFEIVTILILVGFGAGTLGSLIGVGGGVIIVPALTFLGLQPTQISSTSLFPVSATSASSSLEYARQKRISYRLALPMAAAAIPGAVLGAILSQHFTLESFKICFAILLVSVGLYIIYRSSILKKNKPITGFAASASAFLLSFAAGIISSVFGVGGGVIFVPVLLLILGTEMEIAAATSQLTLMLTSVAGLITHAILGHPNYLDAACLSIGALAGGYFGARVSKKVQRLYLQYLLGIVLLGVSGKLIYDWFISATS